MVVDAVLADLDETVDEMYADSGRSSLASQALLKATVLKATVLMAMYSMRSERAFCERLNDDLFFKWFLDMRIDQAAFDASTFSKTAAACSIMTSRMSSSLRWSAKRSCAARSRANISRSMRRCWRRGHLATPMTRRVPRRVRHRPGAQSFKARQQPATAPPTPADQPTSPPAHEPTSPPQQPFRYPARASFAHHRLANEFGRADGRADSGVRPGRTALAWVKKRSKFARSRRPTGRAARSTRRAQ